MRRGRSALAPLYLSSTVLTLGEGSFGLLVPPYLHGRGHSPVVVGTAVSAYGLVSLLARIPTGALYRSHRSRRLIAFGTTVSSLAFFLLSRTSSPWLAIGLVALDGAGFAVASTANMAALIDRRPPGASAGSIMGWYTGSLGAGYALSGFVGGAAGEALGPGGAMALLALVPLVAGLALSLAIGGAASPATPPERRRRVALRGFRGLPAPVWVAAFVTLHINLVSGVVLTFFPIYGLRIGLTLSQIGVLTGIHGVAASLVRFLSGAVFRWLSYERALPAMVALSGACVAAIGGGRALALLAVAWAGLGLARGLLRVASAALVMDESDGDDARGGAASSVYLAGLDLGKILGPLVGGLGARTIGVGQMFLVAGAAFPLVYFLLAAIASRERAAARATSTPTH